MIPVSLPGGNHYVTMALSLICLTTLLTWAWSLLRSPDARWWLACHRRLGTLLLLLLVGVGAVFPYQLLSRWLDGQRQASTEAAHRLVLDHADTLHDIAMPAGTVLRLQTPGEAGSFVEAQFPTPTLVAGVPVNRLLRHNRDAWSLALAGPQAIAGWTCTAGHLAEFRLRGDQPELASCHLAAGNSLEGHPLPPGTWLQANPAGWLLRTDGSDPLTLDGLPLVKADIQLDRERQRDHFEGLLAHDISLGELHYPASTRVANARAGLPGAEPGDLLFSPPRGRSARRADGSDIPAGQSVLQSPEGSVRAVLSNQQAHVPDPTSNRLSR